MLNKIPTVVYYILGIGAFFIFAINTTPGILFLVVSVIVLSSILGGLIYAVYSAKERDTVLQNMNRIPYLKIHSNYDLRNTLEQTLNITERDFNKIKEKLQKLQKYTSVVNHKNAVVFENITAQSLSDYLRINGFLYDEIVQIKLNQFNTCVAVLQNKNDAMLLKLKYSVPDITS